MGLEKQDRLNGTSRDNEEKTRPLEKRVAYLDKFGESESLDGQNKKFEISPWASTSKTLLQTMLVLEAAERFCLYKGCHHQEFGKFQGFQSLFYWILHLFLFCLFVCDASQAPSVLPQAL